MNAEAQPNAQVFEETRSLQTRITVAVIFVILPLFLGWLLWQRAEDDPLFLRWATRLFVLFIVIGALNKGIVPVLFSAMQALDGFSLFENGEELIAALNRHLEQPVTKEGF